MEEAAVVLLRRSDRLLCRQVERDPRERCLAQRRLVLSGGVGEVAARVVELELQAQPFVGAQPALLQGRRDPHDLEPQRADALALLLDGVLQVDDGDVLVEHRPERREPDHRRLHVRDRHTQDEIGFTGST